MMFPAPAIDAAQRRQPRKNARRLRRARTDSCKLQGVGF
jgi:hypothetical protein